MTDRPSYCVDLTRNGSWQSMSNARAHSALNRTVPFKKSLVRYFLRLLLRWVPVRIVHVHICTLDNPAFDLSVLSLCNFDRLSMAYKFTH